MDFIWIRIPYLFGDNEHKFKLKTRIERSFNKNKKIKLKNPNKINNFIEVSKAAKIIIKSIFERHSQNNLILNISGRKETVKKFAERVLKKIQH